MPATTGLPSWLFRPSSVSRIDLGWPGNLMMSEPLRTTATWRDRIAVGTNSRLILRICSPNPGMSLSATASVASGVTSRGAGPVPPVVSTRWQPTRSASSTSVDSISGRSAGMGGVSALLESVPSDPAKLAELQARYRAKPPRGGNGFSLARFHYERAQAAGELGDSRGEIEGLRKAAALVRGTGGEEEAQYLQEL